ERRRSSRLGAAKTIRLSFLWIGWTTLVERRERLVQVPACSKPFGASECFLAPPRQRQDDFPRDRQRGPRARWIDWTQRARHVHECIPVDAPAPRGVAAETERDEPEKRRDHDAAGGRGGRHDQRCTAPQGAARRLSRRGRDR